MSDWDHDYFHVYICIYIGSSVFVFFGSARVKQNQLSLP